MDESEYTNFRQDILARAALDIFRGEEGATLEELFRSSAAISEGVARFREVLMERLVEIYSRKYESVKLRGVQTLESAGTCKECKARLPRGTKAAVITYRRGGQQLSRHLCAVDGAILSLILMKNLERAALSIDSYFKELLGGEADREHSQSVRSDGEVQT